MFPIPCSLSFSNSLTTGPITLAIAASFIVSLNSAICFATPLSVFRGRTRNPSRR